jgi:hypothetical protein
LSFFLVAAFLVAGCATQQVDFHEGIKDNTKAQHKEWQHFFVYGLVPPAQNMNSDEFCSGSEIARVETEQTFLNGLVTGVTYGIYNPMTLRIYCKSQITGPVK